MSKVKVKQPVVEHIPTFKEYSVTTVTLGPLLRDLGFRLPIGFLDAYYYYTDLEGWGKILYDLTFKSNLYKVDRFDCDNYALKATTVCAERYGLNTLGIAIGDIPQGRHAFNILFHGDGFKLFEPNAGFGYGGLFAMGDNGYIVDMVIM